MNPSPRRAGRRSAPSLRRRDDSGSTLIEAAFAMPIFVLMLFGIIEFSAVLMSYQGATNAVHAGGRVASAQGNSAFADRDTLLRIEKEAAGIPSGELQQIVIWKATGPGDTVPALCTSATSLGNAPAGVAGLCNVYNNPETTTTGAFDRAASAGNANYFGANSDINDVNRLDKYYPPTGRGVTTAVPGSSSTAHPDYLGVYIKLRHSYYTGMFGSAVTITDSVVVLLEPQVYTTT